MRYPLPRINELLTHFAGTRVFASFDLVKGFWQFPLHEDSCHHLCTRTTRDAERDYSARAGLFHVLPPTLLPPLTEELKARKDLHRKLPIPPFKCDPHSGLTLLLPILVMGTGC